MTRYTSAWVAADRDGWLSTFSEGATQEDPVGEGIRHGRDEIATFWDRAMASYDGIELKERALHIVGTEAALEWTIVAEDRDEWVVFDGVDVLTFERGPLIASVRAYWERDTRRRTRERP
jgi:steroid Delta-isomerase